MAYTTETWFSFQSSILNEDTFGVLQFHGREALSESYEFNIQLATENKNIDLDDVIETPAVFKILHHTGEEAVFHGILMEMEEYQATNTYVFYNALLVPRFRWMRLTRHNQVFLNRSSTEMIEDVLRDGGLNNLDYELRLEQSYPSKEFACQYGESHEQFVSRWMERDGLYYFFEQDDDREKLVITDTRIAHRDLGDKRRFIYAPPSGLDAAVQDELVQTFVLRQKMVPRSLKLKDYNYRRPTLNLESQAGVADHGRGQVYEYGDHYQTPEEGARLARVRAEEYQCRERVYQGTATAPWFRPGYTFSLEGHFREAFNRSYLTVAVEHKGAQTKYLVDGLKDTLSDRERSLFYQASFSAIPWDVQFRPERITPKPRFSGTLNAHIDAAGSGQYAELDDQGRYKVVLPFDLSGREGGKASAWLRMAQPYAGAGHGMHFPLHKGTEVLLTFIEGDPDRPIIAGAVPNPESPSVISDANPTRAGFATAGGSHFYAEDSQGHERFVLKSGDNKSMFSLGSGSGSRVDMKSDGTLMLGTGVQGFLSGMSSHSISALSDTTLTGLWWAPLLEMVLALVEKRGPGLIAKLAADKPGEDASDHEKEEAKEEAEKLELMLEGIVEGVVSIIMALIMHKVIEHKVENAYDEAVRVKYTKPNPAFVVCSHGKTTIAQNRGKGEDIFLGTDEGFIQLAARWDIDLASGRNTEIASKNTNITSKAGTVTLKGKKVTLIKNEGNQDKAQITISGANGDIDIKQEAANTAGKTTIKSQKRSSSVSRIQRAMCTISRSAAMASPSNPTTRK